MNHQLANELKRFHLVDDKIKFISDHLSTIKGFNADTLVGNAWVSTQIEAAKYKGSIHPFGEDQGILYAYDEGSDILWIKEIK